MTCQIVNLKEKKVKPVNVVNYNINVANYDVISMMHYAHNLHNQNTAICQQIICVNIKVEYFSDIIIYHCQSSVYFFFVNTVHKI